MVHSRLDTTRLRMVLSSGTEISMSCKDTSQIHENILLSHLPRVIWVTSNLSHHRGQLTSPASRENMDLKEASTSLSDMSSCVEKGGGGGEEEKGGVKEEKEKSKRKEQEEEETRKKSLGVCVVT